MEELNWFAQLWQRVRQGDPTAARELVERYEPAIRRAVRVRLVDARLRGQLDSLDICQSVMGSFFPRAALGQFDLQNPEDLVRLLMTMARNKLADQARKQATARRGHGKLQAGDVTELEVAADIKSPSAIVSERELVQLAQQRLTPEELHLAKERANGREWAELAVERGTTAEALRKRYVRAIDRVSTELGWESLAKE